MTSKKEQIAALIEYRAKAEDLILRLLDRSDIEPDEVDATHRWLKEANAALEALGLTLGCSCGYTAGTCATVCGESMVHSLDGCHKEEVRG